MFATMEFIKITMHYLGINNSKDVKLSDKKLISFREQLKMLLFHHLGPLSFYHSAGLIDKGARHRAQGVTGTAILPCLPFTASLKTASLMSPTEGFEPHVYKLHRWLYFKEPELGEIQMSPGMVAQNDNSSIHEVEVGGSGL